MCIFITWCGYFGWISGHNFAGDVLPHGLALKKNLPILLRGDSKNVLLPGYKMLNVPVYSFNVIVYVPAVIGVAKLLLPSSLIFPPPASS